MKYILDEAAEHLDSPFMQELLDTHKLKGLYFNERLKVIMALHFDIHNPGCYCFFATNFYSEFHPHIKASATIRTMLDFFHYRHEVSSMITGRRLYLYAPKFAKRADRYTKNRLAELERSGTEITQTNKNFQIFCKHLLSERKITSKKFAIEFDVNKTVTPRPLFTSVYS